MRYKITSKEFILALVFSLIGFLVSMRFFLLFLNSLNPVFGFIIYYAIVLSTLFILSKAGLVVFDIEIKSFLQILGTMMIFFSFFLLFNFTNPYMQYVTHGSLSGASNIYTNNSEDGITWFFWSLIFGGYVQIIRIFTYVITPFILTLLGGLLVTEKIRFNVP